MHATLPAACNGCGVERRDESLERVFGVTSDADFKKRLDDVLQDVGWLHLFRQELRTARWTFAGGLELHEHCALIHTFAIAWRVYWIFDNFL